MANLFAQQHWMEIVVSISARYFISVYSRVSTVGVLMRQAAGICCSGTVFWTHVLKLVCITISKGSGFNWMYKTRNLSLFSSSNLATENWNPCPGLLEGAGHRCRFCLSVQSHSASLHQIVRRLFGLRFVEIMTFWKSCPKSKLNKEMKIIWKTRNLIL